MAGHSKWANIKHKKAANDAKRGQQFTQLIRAIIIAAKNGSDPEINNALQLAVNKAKKGNVPSGNIEKAINKAGSKNEGDDIIEIIYEGQGPCGTTCIIRTLTDNKNRTVSGIRHILTKNGGSLGTQGSAKFLFDFCGSIITTHNDKKGDDLEYLLIEAGAEDMECLDQEENIYEIFIPQEKLIETAKKLEEFGCENKEIEQIFKPKALLDLDETQKQKVEKFVDLLKDNEDVDTVFINTIV
jgi:YebC/PmpR family DNA-binding regulatory protein